MGATVSTTKAESNQNSNNAQMTAEEYQLMQEIKGMPKYVQPETFEQKLYRKVGPIVLICFNY
jgi:hypothetical protein